MSDTPRPLTGILRDGQGAPLPNRSLTWYRVPRKVLAQGSSVIVDELFTTQTNGAGQITGTALVPGTYMLRLRLADQDRYVEVGVPEGSGSVNIADLIDTAAPPITPPLVAAAQEARDQAQAAAGQSAASAEASEASADRAGRWGVYVDTAAGLAATGDGDFFSVYDAGAEILLFYENDTGSAELVASIEAIQEFNSDQIVNESGITGDTVTEALDALAATKQAADADLTALANLSTSGLIVRTGAGTAASRTLTGGGAVQVTQGDGVAGDPQISVPVPGPETWAAGEDTTPGAISPEILAGLIDDSVADAVSALAAGAAGADRISGAALGNLYIGFVDVPGNTTSAAIQLGTLQARLLWVDGLLVNNISPSEFLEIRFSADGGSTWGSWQDMQPPGSANTRGAGLFNLETGVLTLRVPSDLTVAYTRTFTLPGGGVDAIQFRSVAGSVSARFVIWLVAGKA